MKTFLFALVLTLIGAVSASAEWPINDKCPVDGKASRPIFRTKTKEGPVSFCCMDCMTKFEKSPGAFKVDKKDYKK